MGVGPSTASVVLNGAKSGTKVSAETRRAILEVARELNYRPNVLARSLRCQRTGIVGFFSGYDGLDPRNPLVAELLHGLQSGCARQGLDLLLYSPNAGHSAEQVAANLADGRMDGLVVNALPGHPITKLLAKERLPVVALADRLPGLTGVLADWERVGRIQARHLYEKGHRHVLYVPPDYPYPSALERQASFLEEAGRLEMEVLIGTPTSGYVPREKLDSGIQRRDERVLEHLDTNPRPTAVLCWDDHAAYRLAARLTERGVRMPSDIGLMGCNGSDPYVQPGWRLSTARAPWKAMGETAIAALRARIDGAEFPQLSVLPVELLEGSTT